MPETAGPAISRGPHTTPDKPASYGSARVSARELRKVIAMDTTLQLVLLLLSGLLLVVAMVGFVEFCDRV